MRSTAKDAVPPSIASSIQVLEIADGLVGQLAAGFEPDSVQDVQIAVHEAVINAIATATAGRRRGA
jgi:hypothetical protein